jgi:hypothetical protein
MSLTLLALIMMPLCFRMVLNPKDTKKLLEEILDNPSQQFLAGMTHLILAAFILSTVPLSFEFAWENLLGWLGLLLGAKGIYHVLGLGKKNLVKRLKPEVLPVLGTLGLLIALGLVYLDAKIILP